MLPASANYPLTGFFAAAAALGALLTALGWRSDSTGWRAFSLAFAVAMAAQAAREYNFIHASTGEPVRADLLLAMPFAATSITLLLGRALWRWVVRNMFLREQG